MGLLRLFGWARRIVRVARARLAKGGETDRGKDASPSGVTIWSLPARAPWSTRRAFGGGGGRARRGVERRVRPGPQSVLGAGWKGLHGNLPPRGGRGII